MACINVNIQELSSRINVLVRRISDKINVAVANVSHKLSTKVSDTVNRHLSFVALKVSAPLDVSIVDTVKKHLKVRISIVCTLAEVAAYLNVTPSDIQWITDDRGVYFDVESNVEWIIVTS